MAAGAPFKERGGLMSSCAASPLPAASDASNSTDQVSQNAPQCPAPEKKLFTSPNQEQTTLPPRQLAAIHLLAHGLSNTDVSSRLGIDRKTLFRWRANPLFRQTLSDLLLQLADSSTDRFLHLLNSSLTIFNPQLKAPRPPTSLRAARALLSMAPIGAHVNYPSPRPSNDPSLPPILPKNRSKHYARPEQSHGCP